MPKVAIKNVNFTATSDRIIRVALNEKLKILYARDPKLMIVEELGVKHGAARVDIAVINGFFHGHEIKSDRDTLLRLPEQMDVYNSVFDKMTLVVGKSHLYEAINIVPDWWGIMIAKINTDQSVIFQSIREARYNQDQDSVAIARLLWRNEALEILEKAGEANGFRSKPRGVIYEKLSTVFDQQILKKKVRKVLFSRRDWPSDSQLALNGG